MGSSFSWVSSILPRPASRDCYIGVVKHVRLLFCFLQLCLQWRIWWSRSTSRNLAHVQIHNYTCTCTNTIPHIHVHSQHTLKHTHTHTHTYTHTLCSLEITIPMLSQLTTHSHVLNSIRLNPSCWLVEAYMSESHMYISMKYYACFFRSCLYGMYILL